MIKPLATAPTGWKWAACALPPLLAIGFVWLWAGPLPLTDEWNYTHALRLMHSGPAEEGLSFDRFTDHYPLRHNDHLVVVPFLFYAPLIEWANYDSRWIIALTVAAFGAQALLYRSMFRSQLWAWFPLVLVLFCPSHFMEFLWGWQITLTLSVLFPLLGLVLIGPEPRPGSLTQQLMHLVAGLTAMTVGTLCSAGGFFGFPAAVLLLALRQNPLRTKGIEITVTLLCGTVVYVTLMKGAALSYSVGFREFWYVLTALGATVWGSPVALFEFGFTPLSAVGLLMVVALGWVVIRAFRTKQTEHLALPLAIMTFGFLCVLPIAWSREYLGNWHIQYALAAVLGGFAAAWILYKRDHNAWSAPPFFILTGVLLSSGYGYFMGFQKHGPEYREYVQNIEAYATHKLIEPWRGRPYPEQAATRDLNLDLILFLAAHGHKLWTVNYTETDLQPLPAPAEIWLNHEQVSAPLELDASHTSPLRTLVLVPADPTIRYLVGVWGDHRFILHPVHLDHVPAPTASPTTRAFIADIYAPLLPGNRTEVQFFALR